MAGWLAWVAGRGFHQMFARLLFLASVLLSLAGLAGAIGMTLCQLGQPVVATPAVYAQVGAVQSFLAWQWEHYYVYAWVYFMAFVLGACFFEGCSKGLVRRRLGWFFVVLSVAASAYLWFWAFGMLALPRDMFGQIEVASRYGSFIMDTSAGASALKEGAFGLFLGSAAFVLLLASRGVGQSPAPSKAAERQSDASLPAECKDG